MIKNLILPGAFCKCLFFCFLLAILSSCGEKVHEEGSGVISEETRNVGAFFKLDIEGEYDIVLQEGTNPLITIRTDENLHQYVETILDGKTLKIRNVEKTGPSELTRIIVTYQSLDQIKLGGASKVSNRGVMNTDELLVLIEGASLMDLNLQAEELIVRLSGAGAVNLNGKVTKQQLKLSGAGNLAAFDLESRECEVDLSGIGSAQIFVTDELNAEVSGVGSIRFKGDPRNIKREISGLGNIERVQEN